MHVAAPQHVVTELVGQLLLHFFNLPIFSIVPQSSGHLLISHFFAIPLLNTPAVGQSFLVFGGELEDALVLVHPPDTVAHVAVSKQVEEELVQAYFPLVACIEKNLACFSETQKLFGTWQLQFFGTWQTQFAYSLVSLLKEECPCSSNSSSPSDTSSGGLVPLCSPSE